VQRLQSFPRYTIYVAPCPTNLGNIIAPPFLMVSCFVHYQVLPYLKPNLHLPGCVALRPLNFCTVFYVVSFLYEWLMQSLTRSIWHRGCSNVFPGREGHRLKLFCKELNKKDNG
jgi:hypothetical protein